MIQVQFAYTFDDYAEGLRAWLKHLAPIGTRLMARAMIFSAAIVLLIGAILVYAGEDVGLTVFCFVYGAFLAVYYGLFAKARLKRRFRKAKNLHGEKVVELDDEQFAISGANGRATIYWHAFSHYVETPRLFVLSTVSPFFYMIPKRALSQPDQDAIRRLLEQKIGSGKP